MKRMFFIIPAVLMIASAAMAAGPRISPNPAEVKVTSSMAFTVQGVEPGAEISWEVVPASLGSIDKNGLFTAYGQPGRGMIRVIVKNKDGKAILDHSMLKVSEKETARLQVSVAPAQAELRIGQTLRFNVRTLLPEGTAEENAKTEWLVIPGDLGAIDGDGNFVASGIGKGRIVALAKAADKNGLGQARIEVLPSGSASKLNVTVSPKRIQLLPGGQSRVDVIVRDLDGAAVKAKVRYSLAPETLGKIDPDGNFVAGENPGLGIIKAEASSGYAFGSDRSFLIISEKAGRYKVKLKPRQNTVESGASVKFEAEVFSEDGAQVFPSHLVWKVIPDGLGSITSEGLFTAGDKSISGKVVVQLPAELGRGQDAASVRISNQGRHTVKINPPKASLRPGQMIQFSAAVSNGKGAPVGDVRILWKVQPENLGTISPQGIFTAGQTIRSGTVVAELPPELGGARAIAPITISSYQVKINIPPNQYNIHPGDQIVFSATVRDANGNDLTGSAVFEWELKSSVENFGTIAETAGLFRAGQPLKLPADGYIMVRAYLNNLRIGNDGIKVTIK